MTRLMGYSLTFPRLYQVKGAGKIVIEAQDQHSAVDAIGQQYSANYYEPIPVCFWWICVFGFEHAPNEAREEYTLHQPDGRAYKMYRDSKGEWFCMNRNGYTRISYVHELQEAYLSFLEEKEAVSI